MDNQKENFCRMRDTITIKEMIQKFLLESPEERFVSFLKLALKIWEHKRKPYGIEYIFLTYLGSKIVEKIKNSAINVLISQKIKEIGLRPDIAIIKDNEIIEVVELKCIEKGNLSWVFSPTGAKNKKEKGDIAKLLKIKEKYPKSRCFELIINRGKWNSKSWGNEEYKQMLKDKKIKIIIEDEKVRCTEFRIKLVEILKK